jgi:hypothetical protein
MKSKIYIVLKNRQLTQFMQSLDMFGRCKFAGEIMEAEYKLSRRVGEVLWDMYEQTKDDNYVVVGIINPEEEAVFIDGHEVFSDRRRWIPVRSICESMGIDDVSFINERK